VTSRSDSVSKLVVEYIQGYSSLISTVVSASVTRDSSAIDGR
jgi:hypothetical protein